MSQRLTQSPQPDVIALDEGELWEDVPDEEHQPSGSHASSTQPAGRRLPSQSPSPRTLRKRTRLTPRPPQYVSTRITTPRTRQRESIFKEEWFDEVVRVAKLTLAYVSDVVGGGVYLLRKPLSFLLFLWLLAFILSMITARVQSIFRPLCVIPGISYTDFCRYSPLKATPHPRPKRAEFQMLADAQSKTFEQLLDSSVGGSSLSLEIKKAEMATSDLVTLLRFSKLTSRELIAETLVIFLNDARATGRGLQRLGSKVGGAVDQIMAVNDYALRTIESSQSNSVIPSPIRAIVPFMQSNSKEAVLQTFNEAMTVLSNTINRLIVEAELNLANLEKLEESLSTVHELVSREDSSISSAKSEVLSELWTKLGGNKKILQGHDKNLGLLKGLGVYRKQALVHVVTALQTLRALSDDMEDLRERVTAPELVGDSVPVDVHLKSISLGLERLKESRVKAKEREEEAVRRVLQVEGIDVQ
ncbi:hypothetical protein Moror_3886 [Moniliophthora roreri MCA 2997]|uniref:Uncharacterized protein n=1 Tax=Moniliophthora roreri (strain MCA 2997) TaxID=1381753 RepID=V2XR75_MONRO|nr:hypothetical protein Moror_3886 [Moniliophthora roreri MCA 2997]KAI3600974.1 hypothetical protein WG66_014806 [Moniliophthora roreri]